MGAASCRGLSGHRHLHVSGREQAVAMDECSTHPAWIASMSISAHPSGRQRTLVAAATPGSAGGSTI